MRKVLAIAGLTLTTAVFGAMSAPAASADPIGPCDVKDSPDYSYSNGTLTVNLRTEVICFGAPVSVG